MLNIFNFGNKSNQRRKILILNYQSHLKRMLAKICCQDKSLAIFGERLLKTEQLKFVREKNQKEIVKQNISKQSLKRQTTIITMDGIYKSKKRATMTHKKQNNFQILHQKKMQRLTEKQLPQKFSSCSSLVVYRHNSNQDKVQKVLINTNTNKDLKKVLASQQHGYFGQIKAKKSLKNKKFHVQSKNQGPIQPKKI